ncbi:hypothetical protein [Acaryochloris marina]|uniref:Uncharacterized protein n=1 Tax=Acaryochloris marina (strain MBIC 11017) TaxID=329726 RepID=B0C694_ACAM1|nr:hypothetical protein [Acaryochloris marina]ABW25188.1 hypothetical protein AM1_0100 [Acaryochloris marina MBIC11017]
MAITAEVCLVDFATNDENRRHQAQQKRLLGFAKWPADCSRPIRIALRVSIGAVY